MCWAHLEYYCEHAGMLRVFADGQGWGDPYCWSVAFTVVDATTIEFKGVHDVPRQCQVRAMARSCRQLGLRAVRERKCGASPGIKHFE